MKLAFKQNKQKKKIRNWTDCEKVICFNTPLDFNLNNLGFSVIFFQLEKTSIL